MGHNSVVSGYLKSTGILWVDGLSTGSPGFGATQKASGLGSIRITSSGRFSIFKR